MAGQCSTTSVRQVNQSNLRFSTPRSGATNRPPGLPFPPHVSRVRYYRESEHPVILFQRDHPVGLSGKGQFQTLAQAYYGAAAFQRAPVRRPQVFVLAIGNDQICSSRRSAIFKKLELLSPEFGPSGGWADAAHHYTEADSIGRAFKSQAYNPSIAHCEGKVVLVSALRQGIVKLS